MLSFLFFFGLSLFWLSLVFVGFASSISSRYGDSLVKKLESEGIGRPSKILPNIEVGTTLTLERLESEQNFTKPPARYTASC